MGVRVMTIARGTTTARGMRAKCVKNSTSPQCKGSAAPRRGAVGGRRAGTRSGATSGEGGAKLWGGRFSEAQDPLMEKFNESLSFDRRMWREDADGSVGYARALARAGVITDEERDAIVQGLGLVSAEWASGTFVAKAGDEDIHTANERRLTELIGEVAGKLHTGRSRNDQVATDTRMWLRAQLLEIRKHLRTLIEIAVDRAEREVDVVMPGFTHLQSAQTVRWSHWLLSHAAAWQRDDQRLGDLLERVNVMPLGSGALAGNPFGIDRQLLAKDLGFAGVCPNSMDAVSDRDYIAETSFWASMVSTHLSRWSEDLIIYCSQQFGMVKMSDAYSTGSSLMPQKKNPDALELLRGKSGTQIGSLMAVLATIKGTPTTYNKDLQEVWHSMYYTVDNMSDSLQIAAGCLATARIYPDAMERGLCAEMLATDLAEYLVRKGVPFRETHHISGAAVKLAEDREVPLSSLTVDDLKPLCDKFDADVVEVWSYEKSAESRDTEGGTSRRSVLEQCAKLRAYLSAH
jgi:argininosuccinate lyase